MPVRKVRAVEFLSRAETGRSRPLLCICQTVTGDEIEVYVKGVNFHSKLTYAELSCELIANQFALDLKLPVAEPVLVCLSDEFIASLEYAEGAEELHQLLLSQGSGWAFGSVAFTNVRRWTPNNLIRKSELGDAAMLYAFDTLVENWDRNVENTNVLLYGRDFKIIDFGQSFERCHEGADYVPSRFPWQSQGIWNHAEGTRQHALIGAIRKKCDKSHIAPFTSALEALSDDVIEGYVESCPIDWGQDTACNVVDYLLVARASAQEFEARLKEVLL